MKWQLNVNDSKQFDLEEVQTDWDLQELEPGRYHLIQNGKGYRVELIAVDSASKEVELKINGTIYKVAAKNELDLLLDKMGMSAAAGTQVKEIKAPMPGLLIEYKVKVGDSIEKGQPVLVLEAMKMENVLKSPGDGVVQSLSAQKGEAVEKGQVLIRLD